MGGDRGPSWDPVLPHTAFMRKWGEASPGPAEAPLGCAWVRVRARQASQTWQTGGRSSLFPKLPTVSWKEKSTICSAGVTRSGFGTEAITLCSGSSTGRAATRRRHGPRRDLGAAQRLRLRPLLREDLSYVPVPGAALSRLCKEDTFLLKPTRWEAAWGGPFRHFCLFESELASQTPLPAASVEGERPVLGLAVSPLPHPTPGPGL